MGPNVAESASPARASGALHSSLDLYRLGQMPRTPCPLTADPGRTTRLVSQTTWRYGYELGEQVGLKSGSLYPILMRLADRDLLHTNWEPNPPTGRPPRHLYRLSPLGLALAVELDLATLAIATRARRVQRAMGGAA